MKPITTKQITTKPNAPKTENIKEQIIEGLGMGSGLAAGLYWGSRPEEDAYTLLQWSYFGTMCGYLIGPSAIVVAPVCVAAISYGESSGKKI